jgi:hypothetical protein
VYTYYYQLDVGRRTVEERGTRALRRAGLQGRAYNSDLSYVTRQIFYFQFLFGNQSFPNRYVRATLWHVAKTRAVIPWQSEHEEFGRLRQRLTKRSCCRYPLNMEAFSAIF